MRTLIELAEFIARRKAWQVFLVLVMPMFAAQIFLVSNMPSAGLESGPPNIEEFEIFFGRVLFMTLFMLVTLLAWLLSIAHVANRRIEQSLRPSTGLATGSAMYVVIYMILAQQFFPTPSTVTTGETSLGLFFLLHILATIGIFYVLTFTAKNIVMADRQSVVSFFDYSGPFFLIWFFPIGVWLVQPRINSLAAIEVKSRE